MPQIGMDATLDAARARTLPTQDYLDFVGVDHYFRDVVSQLLKCRSDKPLEYMHNFFLTVKGMEHTAHREFAFVRSTAHNRHAFILTCERAFGHFHDTDSTLSQRCRPSRVSSKSTPPPCPPAPLHTPPTHRHTATLRRLPIPDTRFARQKWYPATCTSSCS